MKAAILGFVTADALGVPVEFTNRAERMKDPVNEMRGYGTFHQPPGTWSDDSSLTLCLLESLVDGYRIDDVANKFVQWLDDGLWTAHGDVFDVGGTTRASIRRFARGIPATECGGATEWDNGNGALMRILPLLFYTTRSSDEDRTRIINEVASITHRHARSLMACHIYIDFARHILAGHSAQGSYRLIMQNAEHYRQADAEANHFERVLSGQLLELDVSQIRSSVYVVDTLEAAIWCILHTNNYRDAVLSAVNLGGDTDTIAAVTGGVAGLYYGLDQIPADWLNIVARRSDIESLCERLTAHI
jgi:ADP-ribosyl-[dinitrogen reductase] hydrolase